MYEMEIIRDLSRQVSNDGALTGQDSHLPFSLLNGGFPIYPVYLFLMAAEGN
jgi:hypothetical protein